MQWLVIDEKRGLWALYDKTTGKFVRSCSDNVAWLAYIDPTIHSWYTVVSDSRLARKLLCSF